MTPPPVVPKMVRTSRGNLWFLAFAALGGLAAGTLGPWWRAKIGTDYNPALVLGAFLLVGAIVRAALRRSAPEKE